MGTLAARTRNSKTIGVKVQTRAAPRYLKIRSLFSRHSQAISDSECSVAAADIAQALRQQLPYQWLIEGGESFDFDLAAIIDGLEAVKPFGYPEDPPGLALDDLNEQLARLLDWADEAGIKLTD
ncbi:hypothetical protein LCG56_28620 (plasmid) [Pseudomonas cannabina pv. alisalensis]|uniref:Uncharacterized protein n=1 Tax=Pseudomonas syringae pv. maculicola str. ES4326 TaxID=629265 RepID=A0A8T8CC99_PSEYM|nr:MULTISPECIES: hypothetical protein [Pseudomonas syringae group]QHF00724.1 hypothetical protein PMA4326_029990 [Pseudomonas syringae pv. maculicola str. ES4326]UBZ00334.1 hypothetical protein LCG56_28620 [Pseudomonas cannabina pv. alisalensis]